MIEKVVSKWILGRIGKLGDDQLSYELMELFQDEGHQPIKEEIEKALDLRTELVTELQKIIQELS